MKTLVYGAGAVGLGLGSCLLKSGTEVDLVARKKTVSELEKYGLIRTGIFGEFKAGPDSFHVYSSLNNIKSVQYDHILVCVKSYDSAAVALDLSKNPQIFQKDTRIILCQNGWGNAEVFLNKFSRNQVYNARVITGFSRPEPNHVEITVHAEPIHIGNLWGNKAQGLEVLCKKITQGGIPCQTTQHIGKDLWAKMLYNCALNPLGAILDVPYGELIQQEASRKIMEKIIEEIFDVIDTAGFETHWKEPGEYLELFYRHLVPSTAGHRSSTLQSLRANKKTELDALNGAVIKLAREFKVPVPVNNTVFQIVRSMEDRK
jgi:2-dehydropantoate 2-reductase